MRVIFCSICIIMVVIGRGIDAIMIVIGCRISAMVVIDRGIDTVMIVIGCRVSAMCVACRGNPEIGQGIVPGGKFMTVDGRFARQAGII